MQPKYSQLLAQVYIVFYTASKLYVVHVSNSRSCVMQQRCNVSSVADSGKSSTLGKAMGKICHFLKKFGKIFPKWPIFFSNQPIIVQFEKKWVIWGNFFESFEKMTNFGKNFLTILPSAAVSS